MAVLARWGLHLLSLLLLPLTSLVMMGCYLFKVVSWKDALAKLGIAPYPLHRDEELAWFHVSSLGEYNTLRPFLIRFKGVFRGKIFLTYFNEDLLDRVKQEDLCTYVVSLPLENTLALWRLLRGLKVVHVFFMENEFWPVTLAYLKNLELKITLLNGFIQDREYARMLRFAWLYKSLFQNYQQCFCVSLKDRDRFVSLGMRASSIVVVNNLKYERPLFSKMTLETRRAIRSHWGWSNEDKVIYFLSLHQGEWRLLKSLLFTLVRDGNKLILAPRQLTFLEEMASDLTAENLSFDFYGEENFEGESRKPRDVLITNRFGLTDRILPLATVCVVGGSFIPYGGHNLLEPISYNVPTVLGPYYFHFKDIVEDFKEVIHIVEAKKLEESIRSLLLHIPEENGGRRLREKQNVSETILKHLKL